MRRGRHHDSGGSLQHLLVKWYIVERGLVHINPPYFPEQYFKHFAQFSPNMDLR